MMREQEQERFTCSKNDRTFFSIWEKSIWDLGFRERAYACVYVRMKDFINIKNKNRLFTTGIIFSDVNLSYTIFLIIIGLPPRFYLHLGLLFSDVKCYVYVFFTTCKIETSCKRYFIILFTSGIFSTVVKGLLISHICTSD